MTAPGRPSVTISFHDVERWTAAGDSYAEVAKLAEEGVRFALEREDVELEHYVPVGEQVAA